MSLGPVIASDGLVLALDAANIKSFRGEPASNLATPLDNWSVFRSSITQATGVNPPVTGAPVYILERTSTSGGVLVRDANDGFGYTNNPNYANVGDGTWRYSIYVKGHPDTESNTSFAIDIGDRNGQGTSVSSTTGWTKLETTDAGGLANASYKFFDFSIGGEVGNKVYTSAVFIDTAIPSGIRWLPEGTTRGTTVATGGGWADLSGNNYHGEILNGTTTYNDGTVLGGLDFDGADDRVTIPAFTYTPYCLDFWLYNNSLVPNSNSSIGGPSTYQTLISFGGGVAGINLGGWTSAATNEALHIWSTTGGNRLTYTRDESIPVGYHNWIFNWNGSQYDIWVDGEKLNTYAGTSGHALLTTYTNQPLYLGTNNNTYEFYGKIFTFKMYGNSLEDNQIRQNFNATKGRFGL